MVTAAFKEKCEHSGIAVLGYAEVIKAKIVKLHWEDWDRTSAVPEQLPAEGKPENYVVQLPHSAEIAEQIGNLWEVLLPEDAVVDGTRIGPGAWEFRIDGSTWRGARSFGRKASGTSSQPRRFERG